MPNRSAYVYTAESLGWEDVAGTEDSYWHAEDKREFFDIVSTIPSLMSSPLQLFPPVFSNYIKVSGEDESVLLIKDGIFVEPSMILSDNITGTVDQMHVLKNDTDVVELYDGSHKCIACSTVITADPMDVADVLITHKLLCRQLQYVGHLSVHVLSTT